MSNSTERAKKMTDLDTGLQIYARTELGYQLAFDHKSVLNLKQRSLLKMIDGKSQTSLYVDHLKNFGDIETAFKELEWLLLIEEVAKPLQHHERFISRKIDAKKATPSTSFPSTEPIPDFQHTVLINPQDRDAILRQTISDMSDFVLVYMPHSAMSVLKELESIQSFESLGIAIGGYGQLIESVGEPARIHLNAVKQIIANNI
jgi:hypothetical protein